MADLAGILADLRAEHADLDALVSGAELSRPTPAAGWTIGDTVGHLAYFDREGALALRDPAAFAERAQRLAADPTGAMAEAVAQMRALGPALLERWREHRADLLAAAEAAEPGARVPWYGPPMSPASFVTARLMEYWAHGQDVADALGVHREPTARLRHVCHLGVRTRVFSFLNRGLPAPSEDVYVELTAPDGDVWAFGDPVAAASVRGSAEEFALLVTQRRHRDDLHLRAQGPAATAWLEVAQCFAGPPGPGREPLHSS